MTAGNQFQKMEASERLRSPRTGGIIGRQRENTRKWESTVGVWGKEALSSLRGPSWSRRRMNSPSATRFLGERGRGQEEKEMEQEKSN